MAEMITSQEYKQEKDVLLAPHLAFTINAVVGNTGVATSNGKKIIPAGTPVGNATNSVLEKRDTVLVVTNTSTLGANSQGVLRHDVDVTNGNSEAEVIVTGVIDSSKCPTLEATAKTALAKITFINGGSY